MEKQLCYYGCENEGVFIFKNGKKCCSKRVNLCSAFRHKNSVGLKKAYRENRRPKTDICFGSSRGWAKGKTAKTDSRIRSKYNTNIFILSDKKIPGQILKRKMLQSGWRYECSVCTIIEWNSKPLTLQVDHIDGNNKNNTKNNLRFICPNCHSQTATFCKGNKQKSKVNKISDILLIEAYNNSSSILEALTKVGLTGGPGNIERLKKLIKKKPR
jgi:hypothetical protein